MTNKPNGTLYIGVTNNMARRAWEHRQGLVPGFTKRYGLKRLVYIECYEAIQDAIHAKRPSNIGFGSKSSAPSMRLKPEWRDLYEILT